MRWCTPTYIISITIIEAIKLVVPTSNVVFLVTMLYVYRYSSELEIECKVKAAHLFLAGGDGLAAVLARDYRRRRHGGGGGHRHGEGRAAGGAVQALLVPLDAELHDPLGGLGGVAAALDEALDVGLGEAHPEPHGADASSSTNAATSDADRRASMRLSSRSPAP